MLSVREMTKADIDAVYQIECASFRTPWSKWSLLGELNNERAHYLLLIEDEEVTAFCGMWIIFDEAHITNIAVAPHKRGSHYGRLLLYEAMKRAQALGAEHMTLEVRETNLVAQGLYEGFDFVREGYRRHYYSDTHEGALLLWNHDIKKTLRDKACIETEFALQYP